MRTASSDCFAATLLNKVDLCPIWNLDWQIIDDVVCFERQNQYKKLAVEQRLSCLVSNCSLIYDLLVIYKLLEIHAAEVVIRSISASIGIHLPTSYCHVYMTYICVITIVNKYAVIKFKRLMHSFNFLITGRLYLLVNKH